MEALEMRRLPTNRYRASSQRKVFHMRPKASGKAKRGEVPALSPAPAPATGAASQADAIDVILAGVPDVVRSVRVLIVGASQNGKTTFARKLCAEMAARGTCGALVVHDQKFPDHAQYEGEEVSDLGALQRAVVDGEPSIVCRRPLSAEDCARVVRDVAECGEAATLLLDEIRPALKVNTATGEPVEQAWQGQSLIWLCLEGGGLAASFIQLCQLPRMVPGSFLDNATVYVFFGTGGRSLTYSRGLCLLPPEAASVVASLGRGQCCLFFPDREWDGKTYGPA
jgi:hypothetical protein